MNLSYILMLRIQLITKKFNGEVRSSWAYAPYSPGIMCTPRDNEGKSEPERLNKPTAINKQP